MKKIIGYAICLIILPGLALTGCISPAASSSTPCPKISVSSNGRAYVAGQPIAVAQIGKKLKSMRIPLKTHIQVYVYRNIEPAMRDRIARSLTECNYIRFTMMEPKEVTVSTSATPTSASSKATKSTTSTSKATKSSSKKTYSNR